MGEEDHVHDDDPVEHIGNDQALRDVLYVGHLRWH